MILSCNSCGKKFVVPDNAITEAGRLVQCSACGNKWKQFPVGIAEKKEVKSSIISVNRLNLLTDISNLDVLVRVRSSGNLLKSEIEIQSDNKAIVNLSKPENSVSPGQACVFYSKDEYGTRLLGGGWIQSTN